jgi:uncharacterized membrane protein YbhN (UPF0104 family)
VPEANIDTLESPPDVPLNRRVWARPATALSVVVSATLLVVLYSRLHVGLVLDALLKADKTWLVVSVGMILPITFLRAVRFYWVTPSRALVGVGEALRLTLVASTLNVFPPEATSPPPSRWRLSFTSVCVTCLASFRGVCWDGSSGDRRRQASGQASGT